MTRYNPHAAAQIGMFVPWRPQLPGAGGSAGGGATGGGSVMQVCVWVCLGGGDRGERERRNESLPHALNDAIAKPVTGGVSPRPCRR